MSPLREGKGGLNNNISQLYLAVRGKVGLANELTLDSDYTVTVTCVEISDKSNSDGSIDRIFKCQLFAPAEFDGEEVTTTNGGKSLSERQRSALFVYWKECTDQKVPFNKYYELYMEKKIEDIKEKLPD